LQALLRIPQALLHSLLLPQNVLLQVLIRDSHLMQQLLGAHFH
jgi:hypothetical protein